ncbi:MAG: HAD family hydrolase [Chloroflexota bacterium]
MNPTRRTLLFDGDDTLWDNNVHFERAILAWLDVVADEGSRWSAEAARAELDRIEESNFEHGGVGKARFGIHMRLAAEVVVPAPSVAGALARIDGILAAMPTTEVHPFPGVPEVLARLGERHTLGLVTRGDPAEQWAKIDASGLRDRFARIAVVAHKNRETYRGLVEAWRLDPARTWMIGNSPRSDIAPARAAGLRAVLVTHASSWHLEHIELDPADDGVRSIARFEELETLFA